MSLLPQNITDGSAQQEKKTGNQLFPVFLKLNNLHLVVIGGGNVGLEKLTAVLNNSPLAKVKVISLEVLPEIYELATHFTGINIITKAFEPADLDVAEIVIAATNNRELNMQIRQAAKERRLLVNVADKPDLCDFYLGSVVQKGDLKLGISTNGKSPTVAKRIKEVLTAALPDELDITLQQLNEVRNSLTGDFAYKVKELNRITAMLLSPADDSDTAQ